MKNQNLPKKEIIFAQEDDSIVWGFWQRGRTLVDFGVIRGNNLGQAIIDVITKLPPPNPEPYCVMFPEEFIKGKDREELREILKKYGTLKKSQNEKLRKKIKTAGINIEASKKKDIFPLSLSAYKGVSLIVSNISDRPEQVRWAILKNGVLKNKGIIEVKAEFNVFPSVSALCAIQDILVYNDEGLINNVITEHPELPAIKGHNCNLRPAVPYGKFLFGSYADKKIILDKVYDFMESEFSNFNINVKRIIYAKDYKRDIRAEFKHSEIGLLKISAHALNRLKNRWHKDFNREQLCIEIKKAFQERALYETKLPLITQHEKRMTHGEDYLLGSRYVLFELGDGSFWQAVLVPFNDGYVISTVYERKNKSLKKDKERAFKEIKHQPKEFSGENNEQ